MRATWMLVMLAACLVAGRAGALAAEPADSGDESARAAEKAQESAATEEFEPPAGFVKKQRGKIVLYCKKDTEVGTRFKRETCYDEAQMKDYLLAREHNNRDFDQRRAICATPAVCRIE